MTRDVYDTSYTEKKTGAGYEKALQFIKIRQHHSQELRRKLSMRGYGQAEISDVIERLSTEGLLNDAAFGENYLASLLRHKTYGYYGIKAKLMSHGLASNEAENLLMENFSIEQEALIAQRIVSKERSTEKMRLAQKLSRKGFRSQVISEVLGNLSDNMV